MSRKSKIDPAEKVKIIERVLAGEISTNEAARLIGVVRSSIQDWRNLYLSDGPTALMAQSNNKTYSKELKLQAVQEYLDGKSSQSDILTTTPCHSIGMRLYASSGFLISSVSPILTMSLQQPWLII